MIDMTIPWHTLSVDEIARKLDTDIQIGLSEAEVARRLASYGANTLPEPVLRSPWRMLFGQFADFMIMVLIGAAVISGVVGDLEDTIVILVIVLLNAVIGFVQEYRAEKALAALRRMSAPSARVVRDGESLTLNADCLVPGDVVLLETGNIVPADLRLIQLVRLQIAESSLTGESQAVDKTTECLEAPDLPLGDRRNMAYKGTVAAYGRGSGIVIATGLQTEIGKIASLLAGEKEVDTPLQKRLTHFGSRLAIAIIAVCTVVFASGLLRGEPATLMFLTAVSLAVAAIPEALPAVVAILLAFGAFKMVKQHALVRRLSAVETLGSITYICSDKTGTLTQNHMHAERVYANGKQIAPHEIKEDQGKAGPASEPWATLFMALALNNNAVIGRGHKATGEPTEIALLEAATAAGVQRPELEIQRPRVAETPFDAARKCMTTVHREGDGFIAFVKGAPEAVLMRCSQQRGSCGDSSLSAETWLAEVEAMAAEGLRVLAVACRRLDVLPEDLDSLEHDMVLLGLVGLMDPPRQEARQAVDECKSAGIVPVMITGDHPATARAIARRLGIIDDDGAVMTGTELTALTDEAFAARVRSVRVYARVDPTQKIRIVKALQAHGEFVAMTGDGVNDAPALKRADIGIAMGKGGTDVAREAAHMVLLDDNFATIVHAVREGRRIFDNILKFIKYIMACNSGEIWIIFLAPFLGMPIPLLPIQILWINLVTDGLPGLALASESAEPGTMSRPPRPPDVSIFAGGMWQHILWVGLLLGGVSLFTQAWALHSGSAHWQSMVFTVLALSQLGNVLAIRNEHSSFFSSGQPPNRFLFWTVVGTALLQLATLYVPAVNTLFKTQPLAWDELLLCLLLSSVVFWGVELEKLARRRGWLYWNSAGRGI